MEPIALKQEFHKLIDEFEDTKRLEYFYQIMSNNKTDVIDELTPEQQERLFESINQVERGDVFNYAEMKQFVNQWLIK